MCALHAKLSYRTYGAACAAASCYSAKRETPLRVYHDPECCTFHISSRISERDWVGVA